MRDGGSGLPATKKNHARASATHTTFRLKRYAFSVKYRPSIDKSPKTKYT